MQHIKKLHSADRGKCISLHSYVKKERSEIDHLKKLQKYKINPKQTNERK